MRTGKNKSGALPMGWMLVMSMAAMGVALCMWLWVKPQWQQQAGTWSDLNKEIEALITTDEKPSAPNAGKPTTQRAIQSTTDRKNELKRRSFSKQAAETSQLININEADAASLIALPGIGPSKAKAIIQYREKKGAFRHVDDLIKVKGIGSKILAKIRDKIRVE